MSDPLVPIGDGLTSISPDEQAELIPTYIANRGELFAAEQANIAHATLHLSPGLDELVDDHYLRRLHLAMFGQVWRWAGRYRRRETNLGIDPTAIPVALRDLCQDVQTWIEGETFEPDESTVRFHHRLVQIHAFVNGNGRHGRIAASLMARALGRPSFSWGADLDDTTEELRSKYLTALRRADVDRDDIGALLEFARS